MSSLRELDAAVHTRIMGGAINAHGVAIWQPDPARDEWMTMDVPAYSTEIALAWKVHQVACGWILSRRHAYLQAIQGQATFSDGQMIAAWPDVLVVLRDRFPEAICRAAIRATEATS
ncbi:hypothetical protein [Fimbriiglobus ruber]|uniref:Phage ABA sandwich domain-containing protein n=1 Tax=Fimbriiglobus ruber TaxID=1908690 RepID=A0A225D089_9BACT|nr:hypothetical protein [Fimbriiglobus ruber]OWK34353.1 hypothetical protein FRUB_10324 [Fimbriiglobus ruber]